MNPISPQDVIKTIGESNLSWLTREFDKNARLKEIPDAILDRISAVDITLRDYSWDQNGMTSIALLTFAYKMGGRQQRPQDGPKDILLIKVLAKNEKSRRGGNTLPNNALWDAPLYELITGEVGKKIREMSILTDPG